MKKYSIILTIFMIFNIGFLGFTSNIGNATEITDHKPLKTFFIQDIIIENRTVGTNPYAIIKTSLGTIEIELYKNLVPNTVENFINLAEINFYEGLVFHRVIDDFVIQGGGHYTNGTRKDSPFEPIDLEIHPRARHSDGAIGMARTSDPNSATNQFYICDGPQHSLDNKYAVFGRVTLGTRSVVRTIASVETTIKHGMKDWPVEDVLINSLTIKPRTRDVNNPLPYTYRMNSILLPLIQRIFQVFVFN
jgi:cyclophilin family peptidyl-prolyl cis-trans isomerase